MAGNPSGSTGGIGVLRGPVSNATKVWEKNTPVPGELLSAFVYIENNIAASDELASYENEVSAANGKAIDVRIVIAISLAALAVITLVRLKVTNNSFLFYSPYNLVRWFAAAAVVIYSVLLPVF